MNRIVITIVFYFTCMLVCSQDGISSVPQPTVVADFKVYRSNVALAIPIKVKLRNLSESIQEGIVSIEQRGGLSTEMPVVLKPKEHKEFFLLGSSINTHGSNGRIMANFDDYDKNMSFSNTSVSQTYGILEVKLENQRPIYYVDGKIDVLDQYILERVVLDDFPTNLYCLIPYQTIILPIALEPMLSNEQRMLLKQFVAFGGSLCFIGNGKENVLNSWESLNQQSMGKVHLLPASSKIDLAGILSSTYRINPIDHIFEKMQFYEEGRQESNFLYLVIMFAFVVVCGPVIYFILHKRKQLILMFILVPLTSLAFCIILLLGYFIKDGFYKRYEGYSLTFMAPHIKQALTFQRHAYFHSTIIGDLKFSLDGFYFSVDTKWNSHYQQTKSDHSYLSGNFAKSREYCHMGEMRVVDSHSKIVFREVGNDIYAKNLFATKQKIYYVNSLKRTMYSSVDEVLPGAEVKLEVDDYKQFKFDLSSVKSEKFDRFDEYYQNFFNYLPNHIYYVAESKKNEFKTFREEDGYEMGNQIHLIYGVVSYE